MAWNYRLLLFSCLLLGHAAAAPGGAAVKTAVYWGQSNNEGSLGGTCGTGRYAIVIMAFLSVFGSGRTPVLNLAGHCDFSSDGCASSYGEDVRNDIYFCKSKGVKVLLSIGGGVGNYSLSSSSDAQSVATYLWYTFLGGFDKAYPRAFGAVVELDGIDLNIAAGPSSQYYDDFAKHLSSLYTGDKRYMLTAAPQCPYPDDYLSAALSTGLFDHVWVQFYNNPPCQYAQGDASRLQSAWEKWARALPSASVFLGLPASPGAASVGGYIDPEHLALQVLPVVNGVANYGGIMLWSRSYDMETGYSAVLQSMLKKSTDPPIGSPTSEDHGPTHPSPQTPSIGTSKKKRIKIYIVAGTSSLLGVCIILLTFFMCYKRYYGMMPWQRGSKNAQGIESFLQKQGSSHPQRYTYSEVRRMTKSFAHKLGQGGFGAVYRGTLINCRAIAVKMLKDTDGDGEEFMNEVASISRTSHVNVVTLLGFCLEGSKRALLYEYMPNGSLERYTFGSNSIEGDHNLSWDSLFDIVVGIARGLEYLHYGCNTRIVHFDIKPQNILLDQDFCPKISDFGLAKLCKQKESKISIIGARGTIGYIAPEVFSRNYGAVSIKSDVYSFGMVVLEMVGARKQIDAGTDGSTKYFPQWLYDNLDQFCHATSTCDVRGDTTEVVRKMTVVGLWCIQFTPADRPSMSRVLEMLESHTMDMELPPKMTF